jgi:hypothetical protein
MGPTPAPADRTGRAGWSPGRRRGSGHRRTSPAGQSRSFRRTSPARAARRCSGAPSRSRWDPAACTAPAPGCTPGCGCGNARARTAPAAPSIISGCDNWNSLSVRLQRPPRSMAFSTHTPKKPGTRTSVQAGASPVTGRGNKSPGARLASPSRARSMPNGVPAGGQSSC